MATAVRTLKNFVNGEFVGVAEGQADPVLNPATGEEIAQAPGSRQEDVDRAVAAAREAFEGWSNETPSDRAHAMLKIADAIEEDADEIGALESANAGKPISAFTDDEIPHGASRNPATARTCRCTRSRTTPTSST